MAALAVAWHAPAVAANWTGTYTLTLGNDSVVVQEPSGQCSTGPVGGAITSADIAANAAHYQTALGSVAASGAIPPGATVIGGSLSGWASLQGGNPGTYAFWVGAAMQTPPWPGSTFGCDGDVDTEGYAAVTLDGYGQPVAYTTDGASIFSAWGAGGTLYAGVRPAGAWPAGGTVLALGPIVVQGEYAFTPGAPIVTPERSGAGTQVALNWAANGNGADVAYQLERQTLGPGAAVGPWSSLYAGHGTAFDTQDQTCGHAYVYRVRAVGPDGATPWASTAPWAEFPCSVSVSAAGPTTLDVAYPEVAPVAAYVLVWCVSDACSQVGDDVGSVTNVQLGGLTPNTPYTVWVCSTQNGWGCPVAATWTDAAAPTGLVVSAGGGVWNAALRWQADGNPGGTPYFVERAAWDGSGAVAPWTGVDGPTTGLGFVTADQACGRQYAYGVFAENGLGVPSAWDSSGFFENGPCTVRAAAAGPTAIDASWTASAPPGQDAGYSVRWTPLQGASSHLAPAVAATAFAITGLVPAQGYLVQVASTSGWWSPPVTVWTAPVPPAAISVGAVTESSMTVSWSAAGDPAGTEFALYLEPASGGGPVDSANGTATTATEGGLSCGAAYVPYVRAQDAAGAASPWVAGPVVPTVPCPPDVASTIGGLGWSPAAGRGYVTLRWSPVAGAAGYDVWVWDGQTFEPFDVGASTAWDSRQARIYPPDATLYPNVAVGARTPPVFSHSAGGLDLRDRPLDLYCSTGAADCTPSPANNYWIAVSAYNGSGNSVRFAPGGNPCAVPAACVTPTLPLQTDPAAAVITSWVLNGGGGYAYGGAVSFALAATEGTAGIAAYAVSNDGADWTVTAVAGCTVGGVAACPSDLHADGDWQLTPGPGSKTVWAKVETAAGVWSAPAAATVYVAADQAVPTVDVVLDGGAAVTAATAVTVGVSVSDGATSGSPVTWQARYSTDGGQTWSAWIQEGPVQTWSQPWTLPGGVAGERSVLVQAENSDHNLGQGGASIAFAPAAASSPAGSSGRPCSWSAAGTVTPAVCVTVPQVTVPVALPQGAVRMRISLDNVTWGPWLSVADAVAVDLGSAPGAKTVWVEAENAAGAVTGIAPQYYVYDPGLPGVTAEWAGGAAATDGAGNATLLLGCQDAVAGVDLTAVVSVNGQTLYSGPCVPVVPLHVSGAGYEVVDVAVTNPAGSTAGTEVGIYAA